MVNDISILVKYTERRTSSAQYRDSKPQVSDVIQRRDTHKTINKCHKYGFSTHASLNSLEKEDNIYERFYPRLVSLERDVIEVSSFK